MSFQIANSQSNNYTAPSNILTNTTVDDTTGYHDPLNTTWGWKALEIWPPPFPPPSQSVIFQNCVFRYCSGLTTIQAFFFGQLEFRGCHFYNNKSSGSLITYLGGTGHMNIKDCLFWNLSSNRCVTATSIYGLITH